MANPQENQLNQLTYQLEKLQERHQLFKQEILELSREIDLLKAQMGQQSSPLVTNDVLPRVEQTVVPPPQVEPPVTPPPVEEAPSPYSAASTEKLSTPKPEPTEMPRKSVGVTIHEKHQSTSTTTTSASKTDFERFMGENLINKIGILILIIGIGIGAKYAFDRQLISEGTRIVLGYLAGITLVGFSIKLKAKYENFSAVLLSGGMATLYFITYFAHTLYGFVPLSVAFIMMVAFNVVTVMSALRYNNQIIALLGLVGAYGVPFLLSTGSNQYALLFSYVAVINSAILVLAVFRYWKGLFYTAFALTWFMLYGIYLLNYKDALLVESLSFATIFFIIFYGSILAYKLIKRELYQKSDIVWLMANAMAYFSFCYAVMTDTTYANDYRGLFAVFNAAMHAGVAYIFYRTKDADQSLLIVTGGLAITCLTLAVPIQFDGNWVTLIWALEAAVLFLAGRKAGNGLNFFHSVAFTLMALAFFSQIGDWLDMVSNIGGRGEHFVPIVNLQFLISVIVVGAFGLINFLYQEQQLQNNSKENNNLIGLLNTAIPVSFLLMLYSLFFVEIYSHFEQLFMSSEYADEYFFTNRDYSILNFRTIWLVNYTLLFVTAFTVVATHYVKSYKYHLAAFFLSLAALFIFSIGGLGSLHELRLDYLKDLDTGDAHTVNILIRYVSLVFVAGAFVALYQLLKAKKDTFEPVFNLIFDMSWLVVLLAVLSTELLQWMSLAEFSKSDQLILSILWGLYAFGMIALGIYQKKKEVRIAAIVLFGVTLVKLFAYDISQLEQGAKTIIFISLGVLLLLISFLYNKYKVLIWGDEQPIENDITDELE